MGNFWTKMKIHAIFVEEMMIMSIYLNVNFVRLPFAILTAITDFRVLLLQKVVGIV